MSLAAKLLLRCHYVKIIPSKIKYLDLSTGEDVRFQVLDEVKYVFKVGNYEERSITVPRGYITDFASVPKIFRGIVSNIGGYNCISLLHDYLYTTHLTGRVEADFILGCLTHEFGLSYFKSYLVWTAVRVGAWYAWSKNKNKKG